MTRKFNIVQSDPAHATFMLQNTSSTGYTSVDLLDNNGTTQANIGYANTSAGAYSGEFYFATNTASDMVFATNNAEMVHFKSGGNVGIGTTNPTQKLDITNGNILIANTNNSAGSLMFMEPSTSGSNYMSFKAGVMAANVTYTLPTADGTNGQLLKTNGGGTLSWTTVGMGSSNNVNASLSGTYNNYSMGSITYLKANNGSTNSFTISGVGAGTDGQMIIIQNSGSGNMTIQNLNTGSSAANRIVTGTGSDLTTSGTGNVTMIYDGTQGYWIVTSFQP